MEGVTRMKRRMEGVIRMRRMEGVTRMKRRMEG